MGEFQVWEFVRVEPAELVQFIRGGDDGLAVPVGDQERVYVEGGVGGRQGDWRGVLKVDAEFFAAFAVDCLEGWLAGIDVATDEVPAVRVPAAGWVAMA